MYFPFSMISVARTAHEGRLGASERIPLFCHQNSFMPDNWAQALYLTRWGIFGDPHERDNYIRLKRPIRGRKTEGEAEDDLEIIYLWLGSKLHCAWKLAGTWHHYSFCEVGIARETPLPPGKSFHCWVIVLIWV
jgi:hypothetical protein